MLRGSSPVPSFAILPMFIVCIAIYISVILIHSVGHVSNLLHLFLRKCSCHQILFLLLHPVARAVPGAVPAGFIPSTILCRKVFHSRGFCIQHLPLLSSAKTLQMCNYLLSQSTFNFPIPFAVVSNFLTLS